jgi:hypothetical protein
MTALRRRVRLFEGKPDLRIHPGLRPLPGDRLRLELDRNVDETKPTALRTLLEDLVLIYRTDKLSRPDLRVDLDRWSLVVHVLTNANAPGRILARCIIRSGTTKVIR